MRQPSADKPRTRPAPADKGFREFLAPNAIVQSDDAEVERIAREVVGSEKDALRRVPSAGLGERQHAHGSRNRAGAASEAIRQRKGTCAAYAITLASLARAAGIPSQVVMGYAYLSGIWGGHAWVEVWTGSRWVPLDGALPSTSAADAARIACARTSFAEGAGPLTSNLSRVFGNIQIEIMEFASSGASAGSTVKVPGGAAPFTVEGDTYRNPWLGLDVHKPADFRFTKTDAVYPDSTVVAIDDPMGNRVSLGQYALPSSGQEEAARRVFGHLELAGKVQQEKIAGRAVFVVDEGTKAGLAFAGDADSSGAHGRRPARRRAPPQGSRVGNRSPAGPVSRGNDVSNARTHRIVVEPDLRSRPGSAAARAGVSRSASQPTAVGSRGAGDFLPGARAGRGRQRAILSLRRDRVVARRRLLRWLVKRGKTSTALVLPLVVYSHFASSVISDYGIASPAPALLLPSLLVCGLFVGGYFLLTWTVICGVLIVYLGWGHDQFRWSVGLVRPTLFWWVMLAAVGWLVQLFATHLENLLHRHAGLVEERNRISRDIHDTLAQGFTGVIVQLNAAEQMLSADRERAREHLATARQLARDSLQEARRSVWRCGP